MSFCHYFFFFFVSIKCVFQKCVPQLVSVKTPPKLAATALTGAAISAFFLVVVVVSLSGWVFEVDLMMSPPGTYHEGDIIPLLLLHTKNLKESEAIRPRPGFE